jgi:hypothetical protein
MTTSLLAVAGGRAELRGERAALGPPADCNHVRAASRAAAQSMSPMGPGPRTATVWPAPTSALVDPVQAARERLDHRGDLRVEAVRDREEVPRRDPLRHEQVLGIGAVEERLQVLAELLLAALAGGARSARRRVRRDDSPPCGDVHPAELVPERARKLPEENGMAAAESLCVGAVVSATSIWTRTSPGLARASGLFEAQIAGPVEEECLHGRKTTFSASRLR